MNFLKTSFYSGISTSINLLVRLVTNKIVAVYLGTSGMFLLGQLKDFLNISNVISNLGTTDGTIKFVAQYESDEKELKSFIGTGFKIHLWFSIVVFLLTVLFHQRLSYYLFGDSQYATFIIVLAFSLISVSIHTFFMAILNGLKKIKLYVIISIIATIIAAIVLVYLVINFKTIGVFYAFAINQFLMLVISFGLIYYYKPFKLSLLLSPFKKDYFKKLSKFSLMALAGPICMITATLFVRNFLSKEFDQSHAGSWEGMWRISAMYLLFLTTTFKFYLLPTFSGLSGITLKKEVFKVWQFMFPVIVIIAIVVYVFRDFIITILLDEEFLLVSTLIGFHLLGDTFKINGWVLGNILIAKAKTTAFILFQIEWAVVFISLTILFINSYGFVGVSIAYFCTYVVHFTLMNIYFRKLLWSTSKDVNP